MWRSFQQAYVHVSKRCFFISLQSVQCHVLKTGMHSSCCRMLSPQAFQLSSFGQVSRLHYGPITISPSQNSHRLFSKVKLPYEVDANVTKNVLIYSHKNKRFYKILTIFGLVQFVFWSYLSMFSFTNLKDMPKDDEAKSLGIGAGESDKWYKRFTSGEGKYKNGIAVLCFSVGYIVLFISWMYPLRAVHKLWLVKGGQSVKIMTYAWLGRTRSFTVPLEQITCLQSRTSSATQIPMKVKGRWFFFLLDKKGTFHNAKLYDYTVGLMRNLK